MKRKGYDIPIQIRITWNSGTGFSPDPELLLDEGLDERERRNRRNNHRQPIPSSTRHPFEIPHRWIYHLFLAGKSTKEMMQICSFTDKNLVTRRLALFLKYNWISPRMYKRWKSRVNSRETTSFLPSTPKYPKLYGKIDKLMKIRDCTIREIIEETGASKGTAVRYVKRWKLRNPGYYRRVEKDGEEIEDV